jgi:anaerobic ribonucleoside-triphosphate reductase
MKEITPEEFMALSKRDMLDRCIKWKKEFNNGELIKINNIAKCPIAMWVAYNDKKCNRQQVPNTDVCPLCGKPVCPDCLNHSVEVLSRVTGYLSLVSGWNEAKKAEFVDRQRYNG